MKATSRMANRARQCSNAAAALFLGAALAFGPQAVTGAADTAQKHFSTPEEAIQALVAALKSGDKAALIAVFGSDANDLIDSGDPVADAAGRNRFVSQYEKANSLEKPDATTRILQVGEEEWPFPIPLVKSADGWSFDTAAGMEEILDRRIGRNELAAIQVCLAYVDAQREYYTRNPEGDPLNHYAQTLASSEGKRDGLYWTRVPGKPDSPLGPLMARAKSEGYKGKAKGRPYHGYIYKIVTAQGPDADGGAYDYVVPGKRMIGGFALVAYPAQYGNSGVMTFIVNHDGVVYQKDLGSGTKGAAAMSTFNPDSTWKPAESSDGAKK